MKKEQGFIYITTNITNGKQYVGQTIRNFKQRKREHIHPADTLLLYRALKKHGEENFKWVYFDCPIKDLDWQETLLIKELNTLAPKGYNLETGGNKNKHPHETTKQKIGQGRSKYLKEHPETIKGENNPFYQHKWTEEERENLSKKLKGRFIGEKNPNYGKGKFGKDNPRFGKGHLQTGKNNPNYGHKWTQEQKEAQSKKLKGKFSGENNPMFGVHRFGKENPMFGKKRPDLVERNKKRKENKCEFGTKSTAQKP
jgi:group I intron endonuclease